jgi:prophage regulatory protein
MPARILRLPVVLDLTGLSRSTIYLRIKRGEFPKPVSLGARAIGWREADVQDWLKGLSERIPGEQFPGVKRRLKANKGDRR